MLGTGVRRRSWVLVGVVAATLAVLATSCGGNGGGGGGATADKARLIMGWVPSPQFGGFYAAQQQGYYKDAGLDVTLDAGPVESPIQIVAAGGAQFGFGDADEVLQARAQSIPIVGVFPTFQTAVRILIYHQENPLKSFADLNNRTVFVDLGDTWWQFVAQKYHLTGVQERGYNAQGFLRDKNAVIQGYAGDQLELQAADPTAKLGVMKVADSGWNPYMQVLFTSENFAKDNPDVVKRFVEASVKGWQYYKDNYQKVDAYIAGQKGAESSASVMDKIAAIYQPFIYEGGFPAKMSSTRWTQTMDALQATDVLHQPVDINTTFTNQFMP